MNGLAQKVKTQPAARISKHYSEDLANLVASLLNKDPRARPEAKAVLSMSAVQARMAAVLTDDDGPWAGDDLRSHLIATIRVPAAFGYGGLRPAALNLPAPNYPVLKPSVATDGMGGNDEPSPMSGNGTPMMDEAASAKAASAAARPVAASSSAAPNVAPARAPVVSAPVASRPSSAGGVSAGENMSAGARAAAPAAVNAYGVAMGRDRLGAPANAPVSAAPRPLVVAAPARGNVPSVQPLAAKPAAAAAAPAPMLNRPASAQQMMPARGAVLSAPVAAAPSAQGLGARRLSGAGSNMEAAAAAAAAPSAVAAKLAAAGGLYGAAGLNNKQPALARVPSSYGVGISASAAAAAAAVPSKYGYAYGGAAAPAPMARAAAAPAPSAYGRYGVGVGAGAGMRHW
jgi:hypothetical protein